jgi:hypothetical protein
MCELTEGRAVACDAAGGVKKAIIFSITDSLGVSNYGAEPTVVEGEVTAMGLRVGKFAYEFAFEMETAEAKDKSVGTRPNSSAAREQTVTIMLAGNTAANVDQMDRLSKSRVVVILEKNDGTFEVMFLKNGGKVSDEYQTGKNLEDFNGSTLTIAGKEIARAPKISSVLVNALLGV